MNGADALLKTLADNGVELCFANPGTSEMQMVAAFDREPRVRPILCLFEGVATGAADGYARMTGRPAATLLHLGPGLANGSANLHNARRAFSPMVNIVGDHATYHRRFEAPLTSDIAGLAWPNSCWVKSADRPDDIAPLTAEAIVASQMGQRGVATLILPGDSAWSEAPILSAQAPTPVRTRPDDARIDAVAEALKAAAKPVLMLGTNGMSEQGLAAAARIAAAGVRILVDTFVARHLRGSGRFATAKMLYFGEMALKDIEGSDLMVLAATRTPVAFFAYPDMPSILVPEGCRELTLATPEEDGVYALEALAERLNAPKDFPVAAYEAPNAAPTGKLNPYAIGDSLARHLPEDSVVADEGITASLPLFLQTRAARRHDWLTVTGGAIGQGLPVAIGAAVATPGRKVVAVIGDGSAAYTLQGLWTVMREGLDVVTIILANRAYQILNIEFDRTKSGVQGPRAKDLLGIGDPALDWVALAKGFGMAGVVCQTAEEFDAAFARALAADGPSLIEAVL